MCTTKYNPVGDPGQGPTFPRNTWCKVGINIGWGLSPLQVNTPTHFFIPMGNLWQSTYIKLEGSWGSQRCTLLYTCDILYLIMGQARDNGSLEYK